MQQGQCSVQLWWPRTPPLPSLWSQPTSSCCRFAYVVAGNPLCPCLQLHDAEQFASPATCLVQVSMTAELKQLVATLSWEANAAATEALVVAGSNALRGTGMLTRLDADDREVKSADKGFQAAWVSSIRPSACLSYFLSSP